MQDKQAIPSVWTRPKKKKEQPALSVEHIVAEAIGLLDEEGIEQLSMRKLGARMNAGATSLYRHVANKDELIELVVDEVYGELTVPKVTTPERWRENATEVAGSLRAMMLRHPWVGTVLGQVGLKSLGPNLARLSGEFMAVFQAAGFPVLDADKVMNTLISYVIGMATSEAAWLQLVTRSGKTEAEWVAELLPRAIEAAADRADLAEPLLASSGVDPAVVRDDNFAYGLETVLDGCAARLARL
ncbi:TetR/AcrR family transcriptional regulator [Phytomonospora endophytica]|uniref:AcrR family transcriptional regulator n=1 Tax=Phytomonospora endophytica TaxID=714109 RepID=A0A841FPF3_9ACTN|nr:TetR/AcrR family transcriptional regulator C-terminal domain-containing protein [Phytomonospora endophytica]MBB6035127.1 AcrR family transcriptional regulator [Phytomonospora endophytica]GIG64125.1 TetR family transcriptional regulator [Phytomonospora endophytica]